MKRLGDSIHRWYISIIWYWCGPHVLVEDENSSIVTFENPISVLEGFKFEDDDELMVQVMVFLTW